MEVNFTPKKPKTPRKSKKEDYVDKAVLEKTLIDYQKACRKAKREKLPVPPIPNYLCQVWTKIGWGLMKAPNFYDYTPEYKQDMVHDGVENCLMYWHNYNPKKGDAFAYFTQIIYYAAIRRVMREKKQMYVKYKSAINSGVMDDISGLENDSTIADYGMKPKQVYDNISEFISVYEKNEEARKAKKLEAAVIKLKAAKKKDKKKR